MADELERMRREMEEMRHMMHQGQGGGAPARNDGPQRNNANLLGAGFGSNDARVRRSTAMGMGASRNEPLGLDRGGQGQLDGAGGAKATLDDMRRTNQRTRSFRGIFGGGARENRVSTKGTALQPIAGIFK